MSSIDPEDSSPPSSPDPEPAHLAQVKERLQSIARKDHAARLPYDYVGLDHDVIFYRAITNVLSTKLAFETFAQIMDGLPTQATALDRRPRAIWKDHPGYGHVEICSAAIERTRAFRDKFDPSTLTFHPKLVREYRHTDLGTKEFGTRLIELISDTLHQIGVYLSKLDLCLHDGGREEVRRVTQYVPPPIPLDMRSVFHQDPVPPQTLFTHPEFTSCDLYPEGMHDMVGYWAENRIIGGVTAFRRETEDHTGNDSPNVFLHPCRWEVTNQICQLDDDQQESLIKFLTSENESEDVPDKATSSSGPAGKRKRTEPSTDCPLPILPTRSNRTRVAPWQAISEFNIYRDIWERMPPSIAERRLLGRRPRSGLDDPASEDLMWKVHKMYEDPPPGKKRKTSEDTNTPEQEESSNTGERATTDVVDTRNLTVEGIMTAARQDALHADATAEDGDHHDTPG